MAPASTGHRGFHGRPDPVAREGHVFAAQGGQRHGAHPQIGAGLQRLHQACRLQLVELAGGAGLADAQ
jgi:hypothetical protein